jgi:hypothetical protein
MQGIKNYRINKRSHAFLLNTILYEEEYYFSAQYYLR